MAPGKIGPVPPAEARTIPGTIPLPPSRGHITLHNITYHIPYIYTRTIPETISYCPIRKCRSYYPGQPSKILSSALGSHRNGDNLLIHPLAPSHDDDIFRCTSIALAPTHLGLSVGQSLPVSNVHSVSAESLLDYHRALVGGGFRSE